MARLISKGGAELTFCERNKKIRFLRRVGVMFCRPPLFLWTAEPAFFLLYKSGEKLEIIK